MGTKQENLVITDEGEPIITVDNLKVAQFIYLLINNEEIRNTIDTIAKKAVLILGRFIPERKIVLDALRDALRHLDFLPIVFDFEHSTSHDFTETIMTLAALSCFIIADITNPKSSPLELQATVPNYMTPFVPIIQEGEQPFGMFADLQNKYHDWVLDTLLYDTPSNLVNVLEQAIVQPALERQAELLLFKAQQPRTGRIKDYLWAISAMSRSTLPKFDCLSLELQVWFVQILYYLGNRNSIAARRIKHILFYHKMSAENDPLAPFIGMVDNGEDGWVEQHDEIFAAENEQQIKKS